MPWREEIEQSFQQRKQQNRWRTRKLIESAQGRTVQLNGQSLLNFCSNDYLALANHPSLKQAAIAATETYGTGSGASHLVCGHQELHHQLEQELATMLGAEQAVVFSTGYMANLAVPQTFLGRNDLLLEDKLNHASLLDAGSISAVKMKRYAHLDLQSVGKSLADSDANRKMVLTDGTFSMDGDVAPVEQLAQLCHQHKSMLVVDDAHGFGVLGASGAGLLQRENVSVSGNVLIVGTLGKAAGSFGAFIAGDAVYIQSLIQFARTYIYTTALPPAAVAASIEAIKLIQSEPSRRERLKSLIDRFQDAATEAGLPVMPSQTAIQPIVMGSETNALAADALLREGGILGIAIRPPTVPAGLARIRLTLRADHTDEDMDRLLSALTSDAFRQLLSAEDAS
ncbi:8-amino-7-oxononanoate synthase [Mariniblastus sp.]|nr:8-amino-7-oxononanoate synthase [Mariniblastus sp.]